MLPELGLTTRVPRRIFIRAPRPMLTEMLANRRPGHASSYKKPRLSRASSQADARTRTADPFITSEVLYQLSYVGICRAFVP